MIEFFNKLNYDAIIAAIMGSMFFMLKNDKMSIYRRLAYLFIGVSASYYTAQGAILFFNLNEGLVGVIGFASGVMAIPFADFLLNVAENPIKFWAQFKKADKGE